jgi:hypothetical protein
MTYAKVESFGEEESQSWALLSNSFHSSLPDDLPEGLVEFTEYWQHQPPRLLQACLPFTTQA